MTEKPRQPCFETINTGTCSRGTGCSYSHNENDLYEGQQRILNDNKYRSRSSQSNGSSAERSNDNSNYSNDRFHNYPINNSKNTSAVFDKDAYDCLNRELAEKRNLQISLEIQTAANDFSISYIEQRIAQIKERNKQVSIDVVSSPDKVEVHLIRMCFNFASFNF